MHYKTLDVKIVGLESDRRICESRSCCGETIRPDDLLRFKLAVVNINGKLGETIKAARVHDGTEFGTVRFLSINIVKTGMEKFFGQFAQVIELWENLSNETMRRKRYHSNGVA